MKKTTFSPPAVGGSSLLVIFGVLCLTVFSLLTLTTAQSSKRLSDSAAQAESAYYEADLQAELLFAQIRSGETLDQVRWEGDFCSYSVPISDHQTLQVQLERTGQGWRVLRWQACITSLPAADQPLSLWDGTTPQEVSP